MAGKILIVGGGTMGRGIAGLCALKGHSTSDYEADEAARHRKSGRGFYGWDGDAARALTPEEESQ